MTRKVDPMRTTVAWWLTPRLATEVPRHMPSYWGPLAVMGRNLAAFQRQVGAAMMPALRSMAAAWRQVTEQWGASR